MLIPFLRLPWKVQSVWEKISGTRHLTLSTQDVENKFTRTHEHTSTGSRAKITRKIAKTSFGRGKKLEARLGRAESLFYQVDRSLAKSRRLSQGPRQKQGKGGLNCRARCITDLKCISYVLAQVLHVAFNSFTT